MQMDMYSQTVKQLLGGIHFFLAAMKCFEDLKSI